MSTRLLCLSILLAAPALGACNPLDLACPEGQWRPIAGEDCVPIPEIDAGTDAGPMDAGTDAGPTDASTDAGPMDASTDAGATDAAPSDAATEDGEKPWSAVSKAEDG